MPQVSDAYRGLRSLFSDKGELSYGAGRGFFGPELTALIPASPIDFTDMSWLPEIGHASDLGRTQGITIRDAISKIDLTTADDGERPADRGIQSHTWTVELSLADAGIKKITQSKQGLEIERYDSNNKIKRFIMTDRTFQRDSQVLAPFLFRAYRDGVLSTNPFDNILLFKVASNSEDSELAFTSGDQRIYPIQFLAYKQLVEIFQDGTRQVPLHGTSFAWPEESESD